MKRLVFSIVTMTVVILSARAAEPTNYYASCEGKTGQALLAALHNVIKGHTQVSYSGLWNMYKKTDVDANNKIWDMYSNVKYTPGTDQCGTYSHVGDCYNREHSLPQSWFGEATPMKTDAFHVYPTDGKVNGQRSNYPFGECENGERLSYNQYVGAGKLGTCTFTGYSGTVFEPDDVYKGDFARSYLYMAARYYDVIEDWNSDMLAGNAYPAFTTWAKNLLLKWTRLDPVSDKETTRNEKVYTEYQHNRNPFIDHPELAEYIWGNKVGQAWYVNGSPTPEFNKPVAGSTINFGSAALNRAKQVVVEVLASNLTSNVTVSVTGNGFSSAVSTITAAQAMNGYNLTLSFISSTVGNATGTLTLTSGTASTSVALTARALSGLPAGPATNIGATAFVATWTNVDDETATYTLTVKQGGITLDGYPVTVNAADEAYLVSDLVPETTYTYTVASNILTSNEIAVTTIAAIPSVDFESNDDLEAFSASPDDDSEIATVSMYAEYISDPITLTVTQPFALSKDRNIWASSITLDPEEETFFVKLRACPEGTYTSSLVATSGSYINDATVLAGTSVEETSGYNTETFDSEWINENINSLGAYNKTYSITGSAFNMQLAGGGFWTSDTGHNGGLAPRFAKSGNNPNPSLTITDELSQGIGTVSFYARKWSANETATVLNVQYSIDGGATWLDPTEGAVEISSAEWTQYSVSVKVAKTTGTRADRDLRLRFVRDTGARFFIDDIDITGYKEPTSVDAVKDGKDWIAYSSARHLVIDFANPRAHVDIYSVDGRTAFSGRVEKANGLVLPDGLYIVVIGDSAHRVLFK